MDCLFCKMIKGNVPCKKIYEDETVIAILDLYPNSDAHTLIIPKKHIADINEMDEKTLGHIHKVAQKLIPTLMDKTNSEGISIMVNYGKSQAIKHYHMHLLPNYHIKKATMSQEEAYSLLKDAF